MSAILSRPAKLFFFVSVTAAAVMASFIQTNAREGFVAGTAGRGGGAWDHGGTWGHGDNWDHGDGWDHGGAIAAGVAGGVAGTMAGSVLQGSMPAAYPPPGQNCQWEQREEQRPYSFHIGQVYVCH